MATDTSLQCFLDFECVLFVFSALRVGWRIVFLMSQTSMELNSTRSYKASARAIANDCIKENGFEKQLALACLHAGLATNRLKKNVVQVK